MKKEQEPNEKTKKEKQKTIIIKCTIIAALSLIIGLIIGDIIQRFL